MLPKNLTFEISAILILKKDKRGRNDGDFRLLLIYCLFNKKIIENPKESTE